MTRPSILLSGMLAVLTTTVAVARAQPAPALPPVEEGADETEADAVSAPVPEAVPHQNHKKAKAAEKKVKADKKRRTGDTLEVTGRVFARGTASSEDSGAWQSDLGLASARLGVDYQWRQKLRAEISYELTKSSLRDAYVQLELGHGLRLRAGRFKLPVGAIEQTSAWTLPTIDRGMVADILADGIAATGRRSALGLRWRAPERGAIRPSVEVVVAQLRKLGGGDTDALVGDGGGLTVAARAEVQVRRRYTVALTGESRNVDFVNRVERFWTGSLEAELDLADAGYGLRVWGDLVVGQSHFARARYGVADAPFLAGHLIAGYRLGGADRSKSYVEPYLGVGWFNPTLDHKRDDVSEVTVGVAGGLWKRWRLQAQFAYQNAKSARPAGLRFDKDVNDELTITTQVSTAF